MVRLKTAREIDGMRKSGRIAAEVLRLVGPHVRPGVTTEELDRMAEDYIRSCDAEPAFKGYGRRDNPFPASLCVSVDEEVVHGIPARRALANGTIVSIDVGVKKGGWYADHAHTFAVGTITPELRLLMEVTEDSLKLGIAQAVVGARVHDISHAIQVHVEEHGFSVVRDLCGHGVGKNLHEEPSVPNFGKPGTGLALAEGMTLAIEPMVNAGGWQVNVLEDGWTVVTRDGRPSAHFEHTIAIVNGKPEILTQ
ncbi:MAG: type I methionyl aminopeptidase [Ignavibacteria bacterium RIFCSPLOWO2_02_FULL_55_14]|nr:MAG: type I methionyl aminopeptidase [Ignavibacteria bacterium RIFCSPLOWO2_02_FULL_55_14]